MKRNRYAPNEDYPQLPGEGIYQYDPEHRPRCPRCDRSNCPTLLRKMGRASISNKKAKADCLANTVDWRFIALRLLNRI